MNRKDIWHSMSNLYLDDEIGNIELLLVAQELAKTDLSTEELDYIFYHEVHPVLCWNFTVPAGAWGSFDKERIAAIISEYLDRRKSMTWYRKWQDRYRKRQINKLKEIVEVDWEKTKLLIELVRDRRIIN